MDDIDCFVHELFGTSGNCYGYCEICKTADPVCGGDRFNKNGKCPDDCDGEAGDSKLLTHYNGKQIGECCFGKIFQPIKDFLDSRRKSILGYYEQCIEEEHRAIKKEKKICDKLS